MTDADSTTKAAEQPQGTLARLAQLAWQAVPAVAGALSLIGFVALIGGAIQWVRFWAAGLPADQAVRAVPEQELVTIGAVSLIAFSIVGLIAVLGLYLLDKRGNATIDTLTGLFVLAAGQLYVALAMVDLPERTNWTLAVGIFVSGALAYLALADLPRVLRQRRLRAGTAEQAEQFMRDAAAAYRSASDHYDDAFFRTQLPPFDPPRGGAAPKRPGEVPQDIDRGRLVALRQAAVQLHRADREWDAAVDLWISAAGDEAERERRARATEHFKADRPPTEDELDEACVPKKPTDPQAYLTGAWDLVKRAGTSWRSYLGAAALILVGVALPVLIVGDNEEETLFGVVALVVVVLTAGTFGVAHITAKFAWYGIAAFASVILFGAALSIGRTVRDPQVQPVALVRKDDARAVCGIYITETDKRLYLGRVQYDDESAESGAVQDAGRMFWVPVDAIDVVSVGPLQNIPEARLRAIALTKEIQADRATQPPTEAPRSELVSAADPSRNRGCTTTNLSDAATPAAQTTPAPSGP